MKKLADLFHARFSNSTNFADNITGMSGVWTTDKINNKEGEVAYEIDIPIRQGIIKTTSGLRCMQFCREWFTAILKFLK